MILNHGLVQIDVYHDVRVAMDHKASVTCDLGQGLIHIDASCPVYGLGGYELNHEYESDYATLGDRWH